MENLNKLKNQISNLLEGTESKELIQSLSDISATIDLIEADTTALEKDNHELLHDYKELVKHTSFKPDSSSENRTNSAPNFEDFLAAFKK